MAYLCLGIGPTKKQQAFIYVKIHILRVHFLGTSLTYRLPYQRPVFRILYGSFYPCSLADFRTKAPFSAFCTEVSHLVRLQ